MRVRLYLEPIFTAYRYTKDVELVDGMTPECYASKVDAFLVTFKPIIRCYPC